MTIASLGYLGFRVKSPKDWTSYAVDVIGLMQVQSPNGSCRFRTDSHAWRIAIEEGDADDIAYVGFEVAGPREFEDMRQHLAANGIAVGNSDPELLKERGVLGLLSCQDPEGLRVEVFYGPSETREKPFRSPAGVSAFVTGSQGLGHIVLANANIDTSRAFYRDVLGFKLSDIIHMQLSKEFGLDLEFYHCNSRHHTLALVPAPGPKRLHHFMLQTETLDDVGFALDRANGSLVQSLGKHSNDHMVSFYARTPAGFLVEFGWGAREVDEQWHVVRHEKTSLWGHKHLTALHEK